MPVDPRVLAKGYQGVSKDMEGCGAQQLPPFFASESVPSDSRTRNGEFRWCYVFRNTRSGCLWRQVKQERVTSTTGKVNKSFEMVLLTVTVCGIISCGIFRTG